MRGGGEGKETGVEQLFVLPIWQARDSYLSAAAVCEVCGEKKKAVICSKEI